MGDDVILFFAPTAAPALVRGHLETVEGLGVPDMGEMVRDLQDLGGRLLVNDLCIEATGVQKEDLRAGAEIVGVVSFLADTGDTTRTFSF